MVGYGGCRVASNDLPDRPEVASRIPCLSKLTWICHLTLYLPIIISPKLERMLTLGIEHLLYGRADVGRLS